MSARWVVFTDVALTRETVEAIRNSFGEWFASPTETRPAVMQEGFRLVDLETGREYPSQPLEPLLSAGPSIDLRWIILAVAMVSALAALIGFALGLAA